MAIMAIFDNSSIWVLYGRYTCKFCRHSYVFRRYSSKKSMYIPQVFMYILVVFMCMPQICSILYIPLIFIVYTTNIHVYTADFHVLSNSSVFKMPSFVNTTDPLCIYHQYPYGRYPCIVCTIDIRICTTDMHVYMADICAYTTNIRVYTANIHVYTAVIHIYSYILGIYKEYQSVVYNTCTYAAYT
jgi:hypothetical protein